MGYVLWGLSGIGVQILFHRYQVSPTWLVCARMESSGLILLVIVVMRSGINQAIAIWKNVKDVIGLIVFSVGGLMGLQYSFFESIKSGNAATASLLQYLSPVIIVVFLALRFHRMPTSREFLALCCALTGTFLLLTNGRWGSSVVPLSSVDWGIGSAIAISFYLLYPKRLIVHYGSANIVAWAMLIGGTVLGALGGPSTFQVNAPRTAWLIVLFVVVAGTLVAFFANISSLRYIAASESSILACAEPLTATLVSVSFLHVHFSMISILGAGIIIGAVLLLTVRPSREVSATVSTKIR